MALTQFEKQKKPVNNMLVSPFATAGQKAGNITDLGMSGPQPYHPPGDNQGGADTGTTMTDTDNAAKGADETGGMGGTGGKGEEGGGKPDTGTGEPPDQTPPEPTDLDKEWDFYAGGVPVGNSLFNSEARMYWAGFENPTAPRQEISNANLANLINEGLHSNSPEDAIKLLRQAGVSAGKTADGWYVDIPTSSGVQRFTKAEEAVKYLQQTIYEEEIQPILEELLAGIDINSPDYDPSKYEEKFNEAMEKLKEYPGIGQWLSEHPEFFFTGTNTQVDPNASNPENPDLDTGQGPVGPDDYQSILDELGITYTGTIGQPDFSIEGGISNLNLKDISSKAELEEALKLLQSQGYSDEEINQMMKPHEARINRLMDAERARQMHIAGITGAGFSAGAQKNIAEGVAGRTAEALLSARGGIEAEGRQVAEERRARGLATLGQIAQREGGLAVAEQGLDLQSATAAGNFELGKGDFELKKGQLQLNEAALRQEGKLTELGMRIQEQLSNRGMDIEEYIKDGYFNLDQAKFDWQKQMEAAGFSLEQRKQAMTEFYTGLGYSMTAEDRAYQRQQTMAYMLQQNMAQDKELQFKYDSLEIESQLTQAGMDVQSAMFAADLYYNIITGRERLDFEKWKVLFEAEQANKGGGFGGFLGKLIGTVGGSFLGGFLNPVSEAGEKLGNKIFS